MKMAGDSVIDYSTIKGLRGKSFIGVGIATAVIRNDRLLMGLRRNAHAEGTYGTPGGHLRVGESFEEGAARELEEETGLKASEFSFLGATNDRFSEGLHYITVFMKALDVQGEPQLKEPEKFLGWEWFPTARLPKNLMLPVANLLKQNPEVFKR